MERFQLLAYVIWNNIFRWYSALGVLNFHHILVIHTRDQHTCIPHFISICYYLEVLNVIETWDPWFSEILLKVTECSNTWQPTDRCKVHYQFVTVDVGGYGRAMKLDSITWSFILYSAGFGSGMSRNRNMDGNRQIRDELLHHPATWRHRSGARSSTSHYHCRRTFPHWCLCCWMSWSVEST